jgi:hypothetical protein
MNPMTVTAWIGCTLIFIGWIFFRRPGESFQLIASLSDADKFLYRTGKYLWIAGCFLVMFSPVPLFVIHWLSR